MYNPQPSQPSEEEHITQTDTQSKREHSPTQKSLHRGSGFELNVFSHDLLLIDKWMGTLRTFLSFSWPY